MAHLFFSYAHADQERLLPFHAKLENRSGHYAWIDKEGLRGGDVWEKSIRRAIQTCYGVIFAVTETFITRPFILEKEIPWVLERFNDEPAPPIFPILFDKVPLPPALAHIQWIDATDGDIERAIRELTGRLPTPLEREHNFIVNWPRLTTFRGRDHLLMDLHAKLKDKDAKVGIKTAGLYGMGGIGKTQLAVEYAHRYRFHYPAGVYWINAAANWTQEIVTLADNLGLTPANPTDSDQNKQLVFAFKNYLRDLNEDALLILDNVENPADVEHRHVAPNFTLLTLSEQTRARLLLTTRRQDLPDRFAPLPVDLLSPEDARQVLLDARPDESDLDALDAICKALGYLPLALGLAAATLRKRPALAPRQLLEHLQTLGIDRIADKVGAELGTPKDYAARVDVALAWQWSQLESEHARRLLALLAAYPEAAEIPTRRLYWLSGLEDDVLDQPFADAVAELQAFSLIEPLQDGQTIRLHPLVREFARGQADCPQALEQGARQLLTAYHDPQVIVDETVRRGFDALIVDLRATRLALPEGDTAPEMSALERVFGIEASHIRLRAADDGNTTGTYIIRHLRERAHHHSRDALRDACDRWLKANRIAYLGSRAAYRLPEDEALLRICEGHTSSVTSVAISPDGRFIVSGSGDRTIRVWDAATGTERRRLEGHTSSVTSVAISPDGHFIVSGSDDKTVRVWDAASGAEIHRFEGHTRGVNSVAVSPDGRFIVSGSSDTTVRLWEAASGRQLRRLEGHTDFVNSVAVSPDGRSIVSGANDKTVRLWDAASGAEVCRLEGHTDSVSSVAFSPDGRSIVSGSDDETVRLWDMASRTEIRRLEGHTDIVASVAISRDGRFIVSGSDDETVRLWDAASGTEIRCLEGHTYGVESVAISPDGRFIVSSSWDKTIRVWDAASGAQRHRLEGHTNYVSSVAISPDGRFIVSGAWDKTIRVWDAASGAQTRRLDGHTRSITSVAISPDGRFIVSGSWDNTVRVWDAASGTETQRLKGHTGMVSSVAISPDGRFIVSGSWDKTVRVWDAASGMQIRLDGHTNYVFSVAISPDGRFIVSGSYDKTVRVWDAASGAQIHRLVGHTGEVSSVAISPDRQFIVSGADDETVRVWDAASGTEIRRLDGHTNYVFSVAISPDGRFIVSGSYDKTVRVWEASTGKQAALLYAGETVSAVAFAGARRVVLGRASGHIQVLDLVLPE